MEPVVAFEEKPIVRIGDGSNQCPPDEVVGAKAANLARMSALGLPVPPAFVLPIRLCAAIVRGAPDAERALREGLAEGIAFLEQQTGKRFGDRHRPLLVSVRSGAARSMPGMLDTVLDVGCTLPAVRGLVRLTGNPRFAWDTRRRFLEGYAETVLGLDPAPFAARRADITARECVDGDHALDSEACERLAAADQAVIEECDVTIPDDPVEQLVGAARAVYRSWMSERAATYRMLQHLEHLQGTAVTVQAMVFGNSGTRSGAGVAFSRDPSTGQRAPVIDILFDAQGEDVVSGRRSPVTEAALTGALPSVAAELRDILQRLEQGFADVQDVEFTIENEKLWILQTRAAKRTPRAALKIAIDQVAEGLIDKAEALRRLHGLDPAALMETRLAGAGEPAIRGVGASGGIAVGRAAFDSDSAGRMAASGAPVILVRPDTSTADIAGFAAASGIVTAAGGRTAHAALVARQMAKPCVVGCTAMTVELAERRARLAGATIAEGDWLSIDGGDGGIYLGRREIISSRPDDALAEVVGWREAECKTAASAAAS
jgi:pyruvate,orthophosphate dikinase